MQNVVVVLHFLRACSLAGRPRPAGLRLREFGLASNSALLSGGRLSSGGAVVARISRIRHVMYLSWFTEIASGSL